MPLIPNKREFLARRLRNTGLLALIERLARRPGLLVLTYHRIGDPAAQPYYAPVASATIDALDDELATLKRTHRIIGQTELLALADNGFHTSEPTALITFDDGYRDNFDDALPVLRARGVPATFFLPTSFFESPRLPWWDHIAYVIRHARVALLRLDRPEPMEVNLRETSLADAISRVVWSYFHHLDVDEAAFRRELEERAGVEVNDDALGRALFMTWDQARTLIASGMSIGSHSQTHRPLGRLTEDEQREELVSSRQTLESTLGCEVATLAYPYGWPETYTATTIRLAREAGYRLAFSSTEGLNRAGDTDPFALRRLGVGFADPPIVHRARWAMQQAWGRSVF